MEKAVRELLCQGCESEYPVWYCDHFLWNPLAEQLEKEFGLPIHFLCLNCFACHVNRIVKTSADGSVIWKLDIGSSGDISTFFRGENATAQAQTP